MQLNIPPVIENIEEIKAIYDAEEKVGQQLENEIRDRDLDTCIRTSTEYGIARREKILKIQPQDTDSLEDRKFRVLTKWYDDCPYTNQDLINRLDNLLGNGNYTLVILPETMELKCLVELTRKQMYNDFEQLLEEIVPLNMTIDIGLRYNQHDTLHGFTHDYLHTYTRVYRNGTNYRDIWYDAKDDQKEANKSDWYQSESEYNTAKQKMLKSVYQNGGFWVGRYEAGIEKNRTSSGTATTTPLSKQNLYPYNYVTRTQAKKLAEQVEAGSYTSSLMFGVQWDLALKFIEEKTVAISKESNKENVRTKIVADLKEDSKNIGNFKNNLCILPY